MSRVERGGFSYGGYWKLPAFPLPWGGRRKRDDQERQKDKKCYWFKELDECKRRKGRGPCCTGCSTDQDVWDCGVTCTSNRDVATCCPTSCEKCFE